MTQLPRCAPDFILYHCAQHLTRHARACRGHPRLAFFKAAKTWMAGTRPAMTWRVHRSLQELAQLAPQTHIAASRDTRPAATESPSCEPRAILRADRAASGTS